MKRVQTVALIAYSIVNFVIAYSQTKEVLMVRTKTIVRFEHIAFNVPDPVAMAKWYTTNLGMKIKRSDSAPTFTTFIADSNEHMMVELFYNADYPLLEPMKINFMSIHLAFATPNIAETEKNLLMNGATIADSLRKTDSGDQVLVLRDPWGLPIQFVERSKPMLTFSGLYFEHFAINVGDAREKSKWFTEHLGMIIVREGKAPTYGMFIADAGKHMMFELYQNDKYPMLDLHKIDPMSLHVAFVVKNIHIAKEELMTAGAKIATDISTTASGDTVLMLRDPWGQPIQFVTRKVPMVQ